HCVEMAGERRRSLVLVPDNACDRIAAHLTGDFERDQRRRMARAGDHHGYRIQEAQFRRGDRRVRHVARRNIDCEARELFGYSHPVLLSDLISAKSRAHKQENLMWPKGKNHTAEKFVYSTSAGCCQGLALNFGRIPCRISNCLCRVTSRRPSTRGRYSSIRWAASSA